MQASKFLCTTV